MESPVVIDVRGMKCPLPVLKTAQRMRGAEAGTLFLVLATDDLAALDLPNFCREEGHVLVGSGRAGNALRFEIRKGGGEGRSR